MKTKNINLTTSARKKRSKFMNSSELLAYATQNGLTEKDVTESVSSRMARPSYDVSFNSKVPSRMMYTV